MIEEPLLNLRVNGGLKSCFFKRLESPDNVHQISILLPHSDVGLLLSELLNTSKFGLEAQGIPHLIEKESQEEITDIAVKSLETGLLNFVQAIGKTVA